MPRNIEVSQPLSAKPLHPVLRTALSSLDVQLEVELAQYRCHQMVRRLSPLVLRSQSSIQKTSHEILQARATTTELSENTHPIDHPDSNSQTSILTPSSPEGTTPELADPLTFDAYLEFAKAYWHSEKTKAFTKPRLLKGVCKPLAVAAISLLLSIPLSYVMIRQASLNSIHSDTCPGGTKLSLQRCSNFR